MTIAAFDLIRGVSADEMLRDHQFLSDWQRLYESCPYGTVYQSPGFVRTWYAAYRTEWQPVIVRSVDANGDFVGLWLLAYNATTRTLAHAGAHQAEYHTWLAPPGNVADFIAQAWTKLTQVFAFPNLQFKYLPAPELIGTLRSALGSKSPVVANTKNRPLRILNTEDVSADLTKQSYKRKFNGIKRLGTYEFVRVTSPEELDHAFDDLIAYYDFRQGAINHSCPFRDDPNKREFLSALFAEANEDVYVTIAYLDQQPVAAFWGAPTGRTVHLGMLIHSPFLSKYSVGRTLIFQLSKLLLESDKRVLDLTPGGDAWKEGFANAHDQVAEAIVYRSRLRAARARSVATLLRCGKSSLARLGVRPEQAKALAHAAVRARPGFVYRRTRSWLCAGRELRIYRAGAALATRYSADPRVRCNSLRDLLCFEPAESWQARDEFLSSAYARMERGERSYTVSIGSRLAHYGWMVVGQTRSLLSEVKQSIVLPPGSVTFYDFFSDPKCRRAGLYRATLGHMVATAFSDDSVQNAYITVLSDNMASRHVIESMGFTYEASLYWRSRAGKESKWAGRGFAESELRLDVAGTA